MPLTDSLTAFWELGEASSSTRNDSVGTSHLADTNGVDQGAALIAAGNSADFERDSSEYLSVASNSALAMAGDTDFTLMAWVRIETKPTADMNIVGKVSASDGEYALSYRYQGGAVDRFRLTVWGASGFGEGNACDALLAESPANGTTYCLFGWHDSTADTLTIKVMGQPDETPASGHTGGVFNGTTNLYIGGEPHFSGYFDGRIDQVGIWKRVLTSDERTALYNGGSGLTYAQMVGGSPSVSPSPSPSGGGLFMSRNVLDYD